MLMKNKRSSFGSIGPFDQETEEDFNNKHTDLSLDSKDSGSESSFLPPIGLKIKAKNSVFRFHYPQFTKHIKKKSSMLLQDHYQPKNI